MYSLRAFSTVREIIPTVYDNELFEKESSARPLYSQYPERIDFSLKTEQTADNVDYTSDLL